MSYLIEALSALEILDSRGRPTVLAFITVNGRKTSASVPSGASTGSAEAIELRDGDITRYAGLGCVKAVTHVNQDIAGCMVGKPFVDQAALDQTLLELDGTGNKSRFGANAILAVSIAFARACALVDGIELFQHFAHIAGTTPRLPQLTVNLFSGGKHAGGQVPIQDVLLVPTSRVVGVALEQIVAVVREAERLVKTKYNERPLKADEGGLAPPFRSVEEMFTDAVACIEKAGLEPGKDMSLAVDVASSHFYVDDKYDIEHRLLSPSEMIQLLKKWVTSYPIISVEDGLSESDWKNWPLLCDAVPSHVMVLGDDFLCTNPKRIRQAIDEKCCNALLLKVNQIGTLTEAMEALTLARRAGWRVTVSARSGETEDDWLADLATGWAGDQIKVGSVQQSERLAKYNRLLVIEQLLRR